MVLRSNLRIEKNKKKLKNTIFFFLSTALSLSAFAKNPSILRPAFKTETIKILSEFEKSKTDTNKQTITIEVEIADSPAKWEYGLMFEKTLAANKGMLFVFPNEEPRQFWMKNTFVDLSIGYFDSQKRLVAILEMNKVKSEMETNLPIYPSVRPAQYALEAPKGWFQRHNIQINDKLVLP